MSDTKDGGPAFPRPYVEDSYTSPDAPYKQAQEGMSLRDYFAGQALAGVMVSATGLGDIQSEERNRVLLQAASIIYEMADAMLKARGQ